MVGRQDPVAALEIVDVPVRVHKPGAAPDAQTMTRTTEPPMTTKGRAILVALTHRYLSGLHDPFVILIEVRKLMYFMQDAGEPLQLNWLMVSSHPWEWSFWRPCIGWFSMKV